MDSKEDLPDLTFGKMPYGSHQVPWDLQILLYPGAAALRRDHAATRAADGTFGPLISSRVPLVVALHAVLRADLARGKSIPSVKSQLEAIWRFYAWGDSHGATFTAENVRSHFIAWTDDLLGPAQPSAGILSSGQYSMVKRVATVIMRVSGTKVRNAAAQLMELTRIRRTKVTRRQQTASTEKQQTSELFRFGGLLAKLSDALDANTVRGPRPITITVEGETQLVIRGGAKPSLTARPDPTRGTAPLPAGENAFEARHSLTNLRVEVELLIFIAQTGMNLSQAVGLRRDKYRWQTEGEDVLAFKVNKARRGGDSVFRAFSVYRHHFKRYTDWLSELELPVEDKRLFPFIFAGKVPPSYVLPTFKSVRKHAASLGIRHFRPQALRRVRINWLLRKSADPDLTADLSGHLKQTLLRDYEEPRLHRAAAEINRFHRTKDLFVASAGPGGCANANSPEPTAEFPLNAPRPDCISPDGCLFCIHHRDVDSFDYCWKLSSHERLKLLEASFDRSPVGSERHPAALVADRASLKLSEMAKNSAKHARWVEGARADVHAGRYHPLWQGHLELAEILG